MKGAKIQLSEAEIGLMKDAAVILTKNRVMEQVRHLLRSVEERQMDEVQARNWGGRIPFLVSPKISKGEQYEGLPYLILDHPRMAESDSIFFVRTMFWWGNFFSTTLHVSGRFREAMLPRLAGAYELLQDHFIGIDPWAHHFRADNYLPIANMSRDDFIARCNGAAHVKIAIPLSLDEWASADTILYERWKFLLEQLV